jgi:hypothetical protein
MSKGRHSSINGQPHDPVIQLVREVNVSIAICCRTLRERKSTRNLYLLCRGRLAAQQDKEDRKRKQRSHSRYPFSIHGRGKTDDNNLMWYERSSRAATYFRKICVFKRSDTQRDKGQPSHLISHEGLFLG